MRIYKLPCGCMGLKPRVCIDKPNIIKMVRLYNCKTLEFGFEDIVTSKREHTRLAVAPEAVVIRRIHDLIEKGKAAA